jgi:dTDP-4-dehydrorhamnose reductase
LKKILVTGAGGQLGGEFEALLPGATTRLLARDALDVSDAGAVAAAVSSFAPELVIHTAAMTNVDACESDLEGARAINAVGAENVARACSEVGAAMVYVSTNYVFDGEKTAPYDEGDGTNPISVYGATKLEGEEAVGRLLERHYVVRTSTLYGPRRRNFVTALVEAARDRTHLSYVDDQRVTPTSTADLAAAILELVEAESFGTYHLVNQGETTWYGWARAALEALGIGEVEISPIPASRFARPAAVPANGVMANNAAKALGVQLRGWREALEEFVSINVRGDS